MTAIRQRLSTYLDTRRADKYRMGCEGRQTHKLSYTSIVAEASCADMFAWRVGTGHKLARCWGRP